MLCALFAFNPSNVCSLSVRFVVAQRDNRMEKMVGFLKKYSINTSSPAAAAVLERLSRNDRNLEVGSVSTELAFLTYQRAKDEAGTETKSCIGTELGMKVNGSVFEEFPFILSARDSDGSAKLVKILRVPEGASQLAIRRLDVTYEAESCKFVHDAIVPMKRQSIEIDQEMAAKVHCRVGRNEVLIMPWYTSTLNKQPSNCLSWMASQGRRILDALKYLHGHPDGGYVHMDVKAMNIFVDHSTRCFLGDFGSCKPIGAPITSCSTAFCWKDVLRQEAHPKYDYFMFLVMVLIECMEDRRDFRTALYDEGARFVSVEKVFQVARDRLEIESSPPELNELISELLATLALETFEYD